MPLEQILAAAVYLKVIQVLFHTTLSCVYKHVFMYLY